VSASLRTKLGWAVAAALLVAGSVAIWMYEAQRTVTFVSGFDEPLTVRLGGTSVTVPPHGTRKARVRVGGADVEVRGGDGRLLDRHALLVPGDESGDAIYNPLGAAPLFQENIVYRASGNAGGPPPNFRPLAGERFLVVSAEHVLEDPPRSISVKGSSGYTVHQHVGMLDGGWRSALDALEDAPGGYARALALARRIAAALPADASAGWWTFRATMLLEGPAAAGASAVAALQQGEKGRWAEYALITAMRRVGRAAELRERYRARLREEKSSEAAQDLARVLPAAEAEEVLARAVATRPDADLVRWLARLLVKTGRAQQAVAMFERLPEKERDGGDAAHLVALVRAGRTDDAVKLALGRATRPEANAHDLALYVRLATKRGVKPPRDPKEVVGSWAKGREAAHEWLGSLLGADAPKQPADFPAAQLAAVAIQRAATRDPAAALQRCKDAEPGALAQVDDEMLILLAGEAWRAGDGPLFERLWAATTLPLSLDAVRGWIDRGAEPEDGWRLDPGERAGLLLARARRRAASGEGDPRDLTAALTEDPLVGPATVAAARWPAPPRAAPPVRLVLTRPVDL
jgi:hypothetical protein